MGSFSGKPAVFLLLFCLGLCLNLLLNACKIQQVSFPDGKQQSILVVAAAASLTDAFQEVGAAFQAEHRDLWLQLNFAASGLLQKQIEQKVPVDLFASAAEAPVETLMQKNLLDSATYTIFARNQLAVVVPAEKNSWLTQISDLKDPRLKHLAIGNPMTVPAGDYAKEALVTENLYTQLSQEKKLVFGENVRQALTYVEQENVDAAIVYLTDAAISKKVDVAFKITPEATKLIRYPIAVVKESQQPQLARDFINFVIDSPGQLILQKYGFLPAATTVLKRQ